MSWRHLANQMVASNRKQTENEILGCGTSPFGTPKRLRLGENRNLRQAKHQAFGLWYVNGSMSEVGAHQWRKPPSPIGRSGSIEPQQSLAHQIFQVCNLAPTTCWRACLMETLHGFRESLVHQTIRTRGNEKAKEAYQCPKPRHAISAGRVLISPTHCPPEEPCSWRNRLPLLPPARPQRLLLAVPPRHRPQDADRPSS